MSEYADEFAKLLQAFGKSFQDRKSKQWIKHIFQIV